MKRVSRRSLIGATSAVLTLARPHIARAAPRVIKVGHQGPSDTQFAQGLAAFARAVAAHPNLAGALAIELHGQGEFGDEGPMLADCRAGSLDMAAAATSATTGFCPDLGILDVPFVFRDIERGRATIDGPVGEDYADLLMQAGLYLVAWLENGLRHVTANRPIRHPADLHGLNLRVMPSPAAIECFRGLGADARPLPFAQLFEALRVGQFDAQENPIVNIEAFRLFDVQKYLCLSGHAYSLGLLVASPDLIDELAPWQLAAVRDCARVATQISREVASAAERNGAARLRQRGMTVIEDVDTAAFVAAAQVNLGALSHRFGDRRVQRLIEAAS